MQESLARELRSLREAMDNDPRYLALLSAERKMEEDEEAKKASSSFKKLQEEISDLPNNSKEHGILLGRLSEAKARLYEVPSVKRYLDALKTWNDVLKEISDGVFGEYSKKEPF